MVFRPFLKHEKSSAQTKISVLRRPSKTLATKFSAQTDHGIIGKNGGEKRGDRQTDTHTQTPLNYYIYEMEAQAFKQSVQAGYL